MCVSRDPTYFIAVTEGYRISPTWDISHHSSINSAPSSAATGMPPSANEALHQVFPSTPASSYAPLPSPTKRRLPVVESDDEGSASNSPMGRQLEIQDQMMEDISGDEKMEERPKKPLRRSGRPTNTETPPSIAGLFAPSGITSPINTTSAWRSSANHTHQVLPM